MVSEGRTEIRRAWPRVDATAAATAAFRHAHAGIDADRIAERLQPLCAHTRLP